MTESITITLALPSAVLSENHTVGSIGGRMAVSAERKKYRNRVALLARAQLAGTMPWDKAVAQLAFFWPDKRRRDIRPAESRMKPAYDGIVDAGVIIDDNSNVLDHDRTTFHIDTNNPRVELTITRELVPQEQLNFKD